MKSLVYIIFFLFVATVSFGQDLSSDSYGMTAKENEIWLKKLMSSEKEMQLTLIQNRFFRQKEFKHIASDIIPIVIVNGYIVKEILDAELKNLLGYQLTQDKVKLTILEKEPEGVYVNKAWTPIIILNINDKRINRLLKRYKLL